MRIVVTADLHYDSLRSRAPAEAVAEEICRAGGDVLVLLGDSASAAHEPLRDCLRLFDSFTGRKFMVPGNHCLWCLADPLGGELRLELVGQEESTLAVPIAADVAE